MTMWKKSAILSQIIKDWCRDIQEKVVNMYLNAYVVLTPIWADMSADTSAYIGARGLPDVSGQLQKSPKIGGLGG